MLQHAGTGGRGSVAVTSHIKSVVLTADSAFALTEQINSHLDEDDWRVYSFSTCCVRMDSLRQDQSVSFDAMIGYEEEVLFSALLILEVK